MRTFFGVLLMVAVPIGVQAQTQFTVTNSGFSAYNIDGANNPTLNLVRGQTYVFNVNAIGHPFYIKTARVTGIGSQYTNGVTGQGATNGPCTFVVPMSAPATLFYQCGVHSVMGGTLNISSPVGVPEGNAPKTAWLGPAAPNPSHQGASFTFGLPRSARVEFAIFDSRGRRVQALSSGVLPAGVHTVAWDGRDRAGQLSSSGVYHYRLKVDGRMMGGRLVVTH